MCVCMCACVRACVRALRGCVYAYRFSEDEERASAGIIYSILCIEYQQIKQMKRVCLCFCARVCVLVCVTLYVRVCMYLRACNSAIWCMYFFLNG